MYLFLRLSRLKTQPDFAKRLRQFCYLVKCRMKLNAKCCFLPKRLHSSRIKVNHLPIRTDLGTCTKNLKRARFELLARALDMPADSVPTPRPLQHHLGSLLHKFRTRRARKIFFKQPTYLPLFLTIFAKHQIQYFNDLFFNVLEHRFNILQNVLTASNISDFPQFAAKCHEAILHSMKIATLINEH